MNKPQNKSPAKSAKSKRENEQIVYGLHACQAAAQKRPDSIIRAYITKENLKFFKETLQYLASKKRAYHVITNPELDRMTSSTHHEGVSFLLTRSHELSLSELSKRDFPAFFAALIGVENPHNVGAIARSAAHFGVSCLLLVDANEAALSASAYRVSQGGLEYLPTASVVTRDLLNLKKQGFKLIAPSPHNGAPLDQFVFPKKCVLLFGAEGDGLSDAIEKKADSLVTIPGTGNVESLNVSTAASIFFHAWSVQKKKKGS